MGKVSAAAARDTVLVLPNQLWFEHPGLKRGRTVCLWEAPTFFADPARGIRFHKQKLVLHRATLAHYRRLLTRRGFHVERLAYTPGMDASEVCRRLRAAGHDRVLAARPCDLALEAALTAGSAAAGLGLEWLSNPGFLCSREEVISALGTSDHYRMTPFYIAQRKARGILVKDGKPAGGRWSHDPANRCRLPADTAVPAIEWPTPDADVQRAIRSVESEFPTHPGSASGFHYPVTHAASARFLGTFLETRLARFGDYEDAMAPDEPFVFHSVLSPLLNVGLLTPAQVLADTLAFAREREVPLNSLEGFVRQIIGWREFMRGVYVLAGERQRNANFWSHERPMPEALYTGRTGIEPFDTVVRRVRDRAYAHHIERLMVLGAFMLLCEIAPTAVYRWFMDLFIDSYDWVMVPNVFGMSQYADGGLITTKPYLCGSNYILKMGRWRRGGWCGVWDALFWRFIEKHRCFFQANPRMVAMARGLERMGEARLRKHRQAARKFLADL